MFHLYLFVGNEEEARNCVQFGELKRADFAHALCKLFYGNDDAQEFAVVIADAEQNSVHETALQERWRVEMYPGNSKFESYARFFDFICICMRLRSDTSN